MNIPEGVGAVQHAGCVEPLGGKQHVDTGTTTLLGDAKQQCRGHAVLVAVKELLVLVDEEKDPCHLALGLTQPAVATEVGNSVGGEDSVSTSHLVGKVGKDAPRELR